MKALSVAAFVLSLRKVSTLGILLRDAADKSVENVRPPPSLVPEAALLPTNFTWRALGLLTPGGNQHIPQYCGACYAFGAMHALQDRIKIARSFESPQQHTAPDYIAAVQVLLNCNERACSGGSASGAWEWVRTFQGGGVPVEGCMGYAATDTFDCAAENVCRNCMGTVAFTDDTPQYSCWAVPVDKPVAVPCFGEAECVVQPYPRVGVATYGRVADRDEGAMRREIAARGPITCAVDALPMLSNDGISVMEDAPELAAEKALHPSLNSKNGTDHIIEVVGWGVDAESGTEYWEIRNSWGDYWADGGFAKVRRGRNDLLIESDCHWVLPSGWGVPHANNNNNYTDLVGASVGLGPLWQVYDMTAVDRGTAALFSGVLVAESRDVLTQFIIGLFAVFMAILAARCTMLKVRAVAKDSVDRGGSSAIEMEHIAPQMKRSLYTNI